MISEFRIEMPRSESTVNPCDGRSSEQIHEGVVTMASILSRKSILGLLVKINVAMRPFMAMTVLLTLMGLMTSKEAYAQSLSVGGGTLSWNESTSSYPCYGSNQGPTNAYLFTINYYNFSFKSAVGVVTTFPDAIATETQNGCDVGPPGTTVTPAATVLLSGPTLSIIYNVIDNTAGICTITAWPTAGEITYGQTLASSTLTGGAATAAGTFAWTTPSVVPATGTQAESITFTPTTGFSPITSSENVTVKLAPQTITFPAPASIEPPSASPLTLSATSSSSLPVTYTITSGPAVVSGNTVTFNGLGTVVVAANQPGNAYYLAAPQVTQSFVVQKATPSISVSCSPNPLTYGASNNTTCTATVSGGATGTIAWTANGNGWTTTTLSGGSTSVVGWGGQDAGTKTIGVTYSGDSNNNSVSTSIPLTISPASQTITFPAPTSPVTYGVGPITLTATASSGLAVTYTPSGPCTVSGSILTITGAGTCSVSASQTGNTNYSAAAQVTQSMTISKATPSSSLSCAPNPIAYEQGPTTCTAAVIAPGSTANVQFTNNEANWSSSALGNNTASATGFSPGSAVGNYTIVAKYAGDANYNPVSSSTTFTITLASQTITFPAPASPVTYGVSPIALTATASSGQAVTYTPSGPCTVSGSTLTITGTGTCTVTATQAGNSGYSAATQVNQSIVVNQASQTITFPAPTSPVTYGVGSITLTATASSGLAVTYTPSGPCTVSGSILKITGAGTCSVSASQPGNTNYSAAAQVSQSIVVNLAPQVINFPALVSPVTYGAAAMTLSASGGASGNAVTFSLVSGPGAVSNNILTITGVGTVVVAANQTGNSNFAAAAQVTRSVVVNIATPTISLSPSQNPTCPYPCVTQYTADISSGPTGTVTFYDGATVIGTGAISGGTATISISSLAVGTHSVTAFWPGNSNFSSVTSSVLTETITTQAPKISWPTPAPITYGTALSSTQLNATAFAYIYPAAVNTTAVAGTFTYSPSSGVVPNGGQETLSATFVPSDTIDYSASITSTVSLTVNPVMPTLSLATSGTATVYGGPVTFTATISSGPTGTVTFYDGGTSIGTGTISSGTATFTTSLLAAGAHTITAGWAGNANYSVVTSSAITQTVNKATPTLSVATSGTPTVYGGPVTFTATISSGPTGTVTFYDGATVIGTGTISGATVAVTTSTLIAGTHTITAGWAGNANYSAVTSSAITQTVNKATPTLSVVTSITPSTYGSPVVFTTTISNSLGGTVTFSDGATVIGTGTISSGTATFTTSLLAAGAHTITAGWAGNANYSAVTSNSITQTVNKATPTLSVATSGTTSAFGGSVTFTATISSGPTGTIYFYDSGTSIGTGAISGTTATLTTTALAAGAHTITAGWAGNTDYSSVTSSSITETVNKATPTLSVATSGTPSTFGGLVTFTATISSGPTGTIYFYDSGTSIGAGAISGTTATLTTTALSAGAHTITAGWAGNTNYNAITSSAITQTVNQAIPTLSVTTSGTPSAYGSSVTFTATISNSLTGFVTFSDSGTSIGTGMIDGATATFATSTLTSGAHTITAGWAGNSNYSAVTASAITQTVNPKPDIIWPTPAAIYYGTPLSATQLNATVNVSGKALLGTLVYTPAAGAILPVGQTQLLVTFTPQDTTDYNTTTATVTQTVQTSPTTTMVTLSPIISWLGYPAVVNVNVYGAGRTVPLAGGSIACTAILPTGGPTTVTGTLYGTSTLAQIPLNNLPLTPSGTSYSVSCAFTSNNTTEYSNSVSTAVSGTVVNAPPPVNTITGQLITPRAGHQATMLEDGTILVSGGTYGHVSTDGYNPVEMSDVLASTEIYSGGVFISGTSMTEPRWRHTATLLSNSTGQVLITGGYTGSAYTATAELYTPGQTPGAPGTFSPTATYDSEDGLFDGPTTQMQSPRYLHTATLLLNGQVLIAGGTSDGSTILNTAELYNPLTGTFTLTGPMTTARWMHNATLLTDGTVLITGGADGSGNVLASAEIYTPSTNQFTAVAPMITARSLAQATLLGNDMVLITGGAGAGCGSGYPDIRQDPSGSTPDPCYLNEAEIYQAGKFTSTGSMNYPRYLHSATVLPDSTVLVAGGITSNPAVYSGGIPFPTGGPRTDGTEEIYNIQTGQFTLASTSLLGPRFDHTATPIPNGVLLAGGEFGSRIGYAPVGPSGGYGDNTDAEVYGSTWITGGLYPKFMVLDIMYAPPGSGSTMSYSEQSTVGSTTSTTNSFQNAAVISINLGQPKNANGSATVDSCDPSDVECSGNSITPCTLLASGGCAGGTNPNSGSIEFDYTYMTSGTDAFSLTTATTDTVVVPGATYAPATCPPVPPTGTIPKTCTGWLGVDHESDIVWIWLNPGYNYTAANGSSLVWNGYATNTADTNVTPGNMDIIPLTVAQLDGTAPMPSELKAILDRNWDPAAYGGAGGLTQCDFLTILQRDPFATNIPQTTQPCSPSEVNLPQNGQPSTIPTNIPTASTAGVPIYDPNIPSLDPATGTCGGRYAFDPSLGQTFTYAPLSSVNQPNTSVYTIMSQNQSQWSQDTTDTYSVGISGTLSMPFIVNSLKASDTVQFKNEWNPSTINSKATTQTLSIKNPASTDGYSGPVQMQVWQDLLYGTQMFYPKPNDTTVTLEPTPSQSGNTITLVATVLPDPTAFSVNSKAPASGTVTFYDGCTQIGTQNLIPGATVPNGVTPSTATLTYTWTTNATHEIRALYSGDANYFHNVGSTFTLNVATSALPYLSGVSPASGPIGTKVTLTGVNLGTTGTVSFNGIPAASTWISSTSVLAIVPAGAINGPVAVTTNGTTSNGVPFTVTEATATATTTTLVLSSATSLKNPVISWTGYSVVASALVTDAGRSIPSGSVSCVSSPSNGASNTPGTVNSVTGIAQVDILDLPVLPVGSTASVTYSEVCTFTPSNPTLFSSSISNTVSGVVEPVPAGTSSQTGALNTPRENHQATLLGDGTVLITGGDSGKYAGESQDSPSIDILASSEIYSNGRFTLGAAMTTARTLHQATYLSNSTGQVLITGGTNWDLDQTGGAPLASAELFTPGQTPGTPGSYAPTTKYDPAAGGFTTTVTTMNTPRFWHTATLLNSGKVLIVGGTSTIGNYSTCHQSSASNCSYVVTAGANGTSGSSLETAELYDPSTGLFTYTSGGMKAARSQHTAVLLQDGTVLIVGGIDANGNAIQTAEIYNPATETFQLTASQMMVGRIKPQAIRLGDGTVLITGGSVGVGTNPQCPGFRTANCALNQAELYNPSTGTFVTVIPGTSTPVGSMNIARYSHTSTMLPDGTVLIVGGYTGTAETAATEIYNPQSGQFYLQAPLLSPRYNHTATAMPGGALVVGGASGDQYGAVPLGYPGNSGASSEFYSVPTLSGGVDPKFMVLNVMYAPPGTGSSVTYTDQTQLGVTTTATQSKSNALTLSGSFGIPGLGEGYSLGLTLSGGYTYAQSTKNTYTLSTTTTDTITVPGAVSPTTGVDVGVDHEADIIWVWLNPESELTLTSATNMVWDGYGTNQSDNNVAAGMMDVIALTVGQLDGTTPIPADIQELLNRDWDPISSGGAGPITPADLLTILQRDPFAVNPIADQPATAPTNVQMAYNPSSSPSNKNYPIVDPNIGTHDPNNPDPAQCGQRFSLGSTQEVGNTFQYATLGSTDQAFSQNYSLQTNASSQSQQTVTDTYFVSVTAGVCLGSVAQCPLSGGGKAPFSFSIGDKYTWGEASGNSNNSQSMMTQALTIKNPLPGNTYSGPVQMQVWKDNLFGTYMFYPKATDTTVSLSSSQPTTNIGDSVTLTAVVTPDPTIASSVSNGSLIPTGYITFYDGCTVIGAPVSLANGIATVNTSWSTGGNHTIQAVYTGDTNYFHNDAPSLEQTVSANSSLPYIAAGGISPASGAVGTVVNITGQNFGSSGVITFNGVPATTSLWSQSAITATVPLGATTGPVIVTANGSQSNGLLFTVNETSLTATTTTLVVSPVVSWSGNPVEAHVMVTGATGVSIPGSVSCTVQSTAGNSTTPSVTLNPTNSTANVMLVGVPKVTSGATAKAAYSVYCNYAGSGQTYAPSQSNTVQGTVTNSPAATNVPTTGMNMARENQQATLLGDGTVLITGGDDANDHAISSSEILVGNSFNMAAPMNSARTQHQATLLNNSTGQVLITGGSDANRNAYSSAELFTPGATPGDPGFFNFTTLYDPTAQAFTTTVTSMKAARYLHTATQLVSGQVLIVGGMDSSGDALGSVELFDPTTGNFTQSAATLQTPRYGHNATLLTDGTVLIIGGTDADGNAVNVAEIYNPAKDSFTYTVAQSGSKSQTKMVVARTGARAVLLGGGNVLITGGESAGVPLNSAEIYSPATGTFTLTQDVNGAGTTSMIAARSAHTATLLVDGTVLIAGGNGTGGTALSSEELYNPLTGDFSLVASSMVTPRSNHTATGMLNGSVLLAGGINDGSALQAAEIFSTSISSAAIYPKFMVLDILYAPPGAGSTMTYTNATSVGTSVSTDSTFSDAKTMTISAGFNFDGGNPAATGITPSLSVGWGHTVTQDGTSTYSFNTTTTDQIVVPGAVAATLPGAAKPSTASTGVDHEADIIRVWLNPATIYTLPPSSGVTNPPTIIWNSITTNPNDPNVAAGAMDIAYLTVSQLDGTSPIPPELQAVLDRDWDSTANGGAGGLLPADFQTILQRDPFATNTALNHEKAYANSPSSYFDPNIPVPDPLNGGQCATRYSFDPELGQTFAFGQLGLTNEPFTQNYSLAATTTNAQSQSLTDQYSVADSTEIGFTIPIPTIGTLELGFNDTNTFTWTNKLSGTKTNSTTNTQALSIKNPLPSDNYTGPTQMQVWQDKVYGTFMFYPVATDTNILLTSSQPTAAPGGEVIFTAIVTADPKIASSTNPPLLPTGNINFYDGCTLLGSVQVNGATGVASLTAPSLSVGTHSILAAYTGDSNYLHNISEQLSESVVTATAALPFIEGVSQSSGSVKAQVVIYGLNFGSSGTVTFNGIKATATAWSATGITVTVPASATTGNIVVTSGGVASNGVWFVVNPPSGETTTSVSLSPATSLSGYSVAANVTVTGPASTIPSGTVSCSVASSMSSGTPFTGTLDPTGFAEVMIKTDLPVVPANAAPVPFTVTCTFTGNSGFANSQSVAVPGTVIPVPNATDTAVGSLNEARENQQATLLQDGTVLVTGGDDSGAPLSRAEIYINGVFNPVGKMTSPRVGHQQTVLSNSTGQVLITGGMDGSSTALDSAELYTPGAQPGVPGTFLPTTTWNAAAEVYTNTPVTMTTARYQHTATQLTTGKVLIAGGSNASATALNSAEIYDPTSDSTKGTFTKITSPMTSYRAGHSAILLLDGTVLIAGGTNQNGVLQKTAEIFNPLAATNKPPFKATGTMLVARLNSQATRLGNGQVLITGGQDQNGNYLNSAEIYDPTTGTFTYTQTKLGVQTFMTAARSSHSATLLYDGTVLISGGQDTATDTLSTMEIYDPVAGTFSTVGTGTTLLVPRHSHTATLLPQAGVLIAGGTDTTSSGSTIEASAEDYAPFILQAGLHPKFEVVLIQYAPPGSGSTVTYSDATTVGTSTGTENTFDLNLSVVSSVGVNLGIFSFKESVTNTWDITEDSSSTYSLNDVTTNSNVIPGACSSATVSTAACTANTAGSSSLGVDHESDLIWIWLNPVANYTITSPTTFVWNGLAPDPDDPNSVDGGMDIIPLSVSQLDGTSPISQGEWDILDRNWDPIALGGAGPITTTDFLTILARDPFATNLTGVGRSTAPTTAPIGSQYVVFDPNVATYDQVSGLCGNRYDFSPGFDMTFPFAPLGGSDQQAITQTYQLATTSAQSSSQSTSDTYKVALSYNYSWTDNLGSLTGGLSGDTNLLDELQATTAGAKNSISASLKAQGSFQWTNKWTNTKNNSTLKTQTLSIKNPLSSDNYTGPEQMQVWTDNLYGTYMFYPKPSDTNWILMSSQNTVTSGSSITLTAVVTADPNIPFFPGGTVTFYDGCTNLGNRTINAATGTVSITAPLSGSGQHTIVAIYSGDMNFFHNNSNSVPITVQ